MKKIISALMISALVFCLAGCHAEEPEEVNPYLEDYELFWQLLEENWPFYQAAQRISGCSCEELKEEYRQTAAELTNPRGLYTVLDRICQRLGHSGHLFVISQGLYPTYLELYGGAAEIPKCQYLVSVMDNETSREFYGYTGSSGDKNSSTGGTQLTSSQLKFDEFPEYKAARVVVPSMNGQAMETDGEILLDFFRDIESKGYEHCIIDIRNNGGGNSSYAQKNIVSPNITEAPELKEHIMLVKGGDMILEYLKLSNMELKPIEELDTGDMKNLNADDFADADMFCTVKVGEYATVPSDEKAFSGKFWLLVGPNVYSSSEYFSIFCKDTGFATIVGQKTGGDGIGIDPIVCALPNTGICFRFSTVNGLNLDGSCNEEMGTTPDIISEDAWVACFEAIKAENNR